MAKGLLCFALHTQMIPSLRALMDVGQVVSENFAAEADIFETAEMLGVVIKFCFWVKCYLSLAYC